MAADWARRLLPLFLVGVLFAGPAQAQDPIVTAAVPEMAEQATYDLVVTISGNYFGTDSQVAFYVTTTTDPGGITVKKVRRKNAKTLEATIDVSADAQTQNRFDIQVRTGGRTGKGTELFKVLEKPAHGDTTPPGDVYDLTALETTIGLSSAELTWTAPADDGLDTSSGPVHSFKIGFRSAGPFTTEIWDNNDYLDGWGLSPLNTSPWPNPGDTMTFRINELVPATTYWVAIRARDEMENWSGTSQVSFTTEEFPATSWVTEDVAGCQASDPYHSIWNLGIEFDLDGRPALLYGLNCVGQGTPLQLFLSRPGESAWSREPVPYSTRDPRFEDFAFDPVTGEVTTAHVEGTGKLYFYRQVGSSWQSEIVERSQAGALSLAYFEGGPFIAYKRGSSIRVAERTGGRWTSTQFALPTTQNTQFGTLQLAFDANGNPAVAFGEDRDGDNSAEVVKIGIWDSGSWRIERIDEVDSGWHLNQVALAWDPVRGDFTVAHAEGAGNLAPWPKRLRVCDRAGAGAWACATLPMPGNVDPMLVGLACSATGTTSLAYSADWTLLMLAERAAGATEWSGPEYLTWGGYTASFAMDPLTGRLALSSTTLDHRVQPPTLRLVWRLP